MGEAWKGEVIIKGSFHRSCNKAELWGGRVVTLSYRNSRLSVFRPADLVSTGFQMGWDNGPEWFHLSYAHAPGFATSVVIPFAVSTYVQFTEKSNSCWQTYICTGHDTQLCNTQISPVLLWELEHSDTWSLGFEVKEHKPLCPKLPI